MPGEDIADGMKTTVDDPHQWFPPYDGGAGTFLCHYESQGVWAVDALACFDYCPACGRSLPEGSDDGE